MLRTVLSDDERDMVNRMHGELVRSHRRLDRLRAYYEGAARIEQMGLAVPPGLEMLETVVNWPKMLVNEICNRQRPRSFILPDQITADAGLIEGWQANNLDSRSWMHHVQVRMYGRGFVTVGTNQDDPGHPRIEIESPRVMTALVDGGRRRMDAALRCYRDRGTGATVGTLLLPDRTIQIVLGRNGWHLDEVGDDDGIDDHQLGRVPVVMFLNQQLSDEWEGASEMSEIIPITDACVRSLTNLQFAVEASAAPQKWAVGVSRDDFVDKNGDAIPEWLAYMNSIWSTSNPEAKIGQLPGSNLAGFRETIKLYGELGSSVTGLPMRYFGANTANPAAEGAIRADESRLVGTIEARNRVDGDAWGWTMALYERFRTGEWIDGNRVSTEWRNAATATKAEEADYLQKLSGGTPVYSREGMWDEMDWSEARKDRERAYFTAQQSDPLLERTLAKLDGLDALSASDGS